MEHPLTYNLLLQHQDLYHQLKNEYQLHLYQQSSNRLPVAKLAGKHVEFDPRMDNSCLGCTRARSSSICLGEKSPTSTVCPDTDEEEDSAVVGLVQEAAVLDPPSDTVVTATQESRVAGCTMHRKTRSLDAKPLHAMTVTMKIPPDSPACPSTGFASPRVEAFGRGGG